MIDYNSNTDFELTNVVQVTNWLDAVAASEEATIEELTYVFVSDDELYDMNVKYLNHNTLTDIITFNYADNHIVSGDIFISIDRVADNAKEYKVSFENELYRVMVHGLLHLLGYNDKSADEQDLMTKKENEKLKMFHVEQ